jgi:lon-related putative ATP-dependent protease
MAKKPVKPRALLATELRASIDPTSFVFRSTAELPDQNLPIGQERALNAIKFGSDIAQKGFNVFVTGTPGSGRHTAVRNYLETLAERMPAPCDWAYVYDFSKPRRPRALRLETGMARALRDQMVDLIDDLKTAIPAIFESEEYRGRRQAIETELNAETAAVFKALSDKAEPLGFGLIGSQNGPAILPVRDGKVMTPEEFNALPDVDARSQTLIMLRHDLENILVRFPIWERSKRDRLRALNRELVHRSIEPLIQEARDKLVHSKAAQSYLEEVKADIVEHIELFLRDNLEAKKEPDIRGMSAASGMQDENPFWRYEINVLVSNDPAKGAPVIFEGNPTLANLLGRIEFVAQFGTLVTDFSMIRIGALHRACGGFLMLDAVELLMQPMAWDALKRALRRETIVIESMERAAGLGWTATIEPDPIPLNVKIVLFGDRMTHALLKARDPDFSDLFKVQADFSETIDRSPESVKTMAHLIATIARRSNLLALDKSGVVRTIEAAMRMADDQKKFSLMVASLADTMREADHMARAAGHDLVSAVEIDAAIAAQEHRASLPKERYQEAILRRTILIETQGKRVGQINGLSVVDYGTLAFGRPARITARVRAGTGQVIDIEREVALGGKLHSKGVLILSGYLASHYWPDRPLSLAASLVFEQSYGGVDGDSATVAELIALLSAIAGVPLKQSIAVTGSLNQHGDVQAIGGVNEKIEGYFDVCAARGLDGTHGVVIPAANAENLMLKPRVVDAAKAGKFQVWPIAHIDQAIEIFTGMAPGARVKSGFPRGTFNALVAAKLKSFAAKREGAKKSAQKSKRR